MFVSPNMVSGRRVAAGESSPHPEFYDSKSLTSALSPCRSRGLRPDCCSRGSIWRVLAHLYQVLLVQVRELPFNKFAVLRRDAEELSCPVDWIAHIHHVLMVLVWEVLDYRFGFCKVFKVSGGLCRGLRIAWGSFRRSALFFQLCLELASGDMPCHREQDVIALHLLYRR